MLVVFNKITPPHVEATMMALNASIVNLSRGAMGETTGYFINKYFVKINKEDFIKDEVTKNYYILALISIFFGFMQILYI